MSELDLIIPASPPSLLQTFDSRMGGAAAAITANRISLARLPRVVAPTPWGFASIFVGVAAGNVDIALIRDSPVGAGTGTRVARTGLTAAAGANAIQRIAFPAGTLQLPGFDYWVAIGGDNATLTLRGFTGNATANGAGGLNVFVDSAWSSGIPATLTGAAGSTVTQWVLLEAS